MKHVYDRMQQTPFASQGQKIQFSFLFIGLLSGIQSIFSYLRKYLHISSLQFSYKLVNLGLPNQLVSNQQHWNLIFKKKNWLKIDWWFKIIVNFTSSYDLQIIANKSSSKTYIVVKFLMINCVNAVVVSFLIFRWTNFWSFYL